MQILEINQELVTLLDFYNFKTIENIKQEINEFFEMKAVQQLILSVPLMKDEFNKYYLPKNLSVSNYQ